MKIFPKLALAISSLIIGTTLVLTVTVYCIDAARIRREASTEQQRVVENLAHVAKESFMASDELLPVSYIRWLHKSNPAVLSASVSNDKGQIVAHSTPQQIGRRNLSDASLSYSLVLTQPVLAGTHQIGAVSVAFSQKLLSQALQAQINVLRRQTALIGGIAVVGGIFTSLVLALSWTRPIRAMARAQDQIGHGHWKVELGSLVNRGDEIGALGQGLLAMAGQLENLDQMKEEFVSGVTHELRSPLAAVESYLNLIAQQEKKDISDEDWKLYFDRMKVNVHRLNQFVNDLLDVAALDRGKIRLVPSTLDLRAAVDDVTGFLEVHIRSKNLVCQVQSPQGLPSVIADADKVRQVLTNLIANAVKFTPDKGSIRILLEHLAPERVVRISVSDTGIGINPKDQVKLFNKFEQVNTARSHVHGPKGTGLGLAICRKLIELHGGTIGVESEWGKGATFFFTLPAAPRSVPLPGLLN